MGLNLASSRERLDRFDHEFDRYIHLLGQRLHLTVHVLNPLESLLANSPWWLVAGMILAVAALLGGARLGTAPARLIVGVGLERPGSRGGGHLGRLDSRPAVVALLGRRRRAAVGGRDARCWPGIAAHRLVPRDSLRGRTLERLDGHSVDDAGRDRRRDGARSCRSVLGSDVAIGADTVVRPVLDFLQTMPAFVYLIPAFALFPAGKFLAIAAAVLYAAPVAIKIAADGIRSVSPTTVEAARAIGSSRWQMISKVQLPMSKGSMVLAANQGLLVRAVDGRDRCSGRWRQPGLPRSSAGSHKANLFGKGLAAGIAITALGIMLDRITVHTAARYGRAETA